MAEVEIPKVDLFKLLNLRGCEQGFLREDTSATGCRQAFRERPELILGEANALTGSTA